MWNSSSDFQLYDSATASDNSFSVLYSGLNCSPMRLQVFPRSLPQCACPGPSGHLLWVHSFRSFISCPAFHWVFYAAAAAKSLQSCPTLLDPIDDSPPGSPVPGILQARTLEWVAISFSNAWKWKMKVKSLSCVRLFLTPWTAAYHAPPSMEFSRQEYWSRLPLPSPEYFMLMIPTLCDKFCLPPNSH